MTTIYTPPMIAASPWRQYGRKAVIIAAVLTPFGLHWALPALQPATRLSEVPSVPSAVASSCADYLPPARIQRNIIELGTVDYEALTGSERPATPREIYLKCHHRL